MEGAGGDPTDSGDASARAPTTPPAAPLVVAQIEGVSPSDKSVPSTASPSTVDKKRRNPEDGGDGDGTKNCSCKKSRCLKLYCSCFANGGHCSKSCMCRQCLNQPTFLKMVNQSSNVTHDSKEVIGSSPGSALDRRKGCRCKKSGCGKKYCDCFQSGVGCIRNCKCDDCRNPYGQKEDMGVLNFVLQRNTNVNTHIGEEDQSEETDEESEDEDERLGTNPRIPPPGQFPTSRESSFQQESSDEQAPPLTDHHFFPKPITQLRPLIPPHTLHLNQNNGNLGSSATNGNNNGATDHGRNSRHGDQFTIAKCIEVMNGMSELSVVDKSIAPDVFLDLHNREVFLSLTAEVRPVWLRRKMRLLPS